MIFQGLYLSTAICILMNSKQVQSIELLLSLEVSSLQDLVRDVIIRSTQFQYHTLPQDRDSTLKDGLLQQYYILNARGHNPSRNCLVIFAISS